jgi:hypothetical protein
LVERNLGVNISIVAEIDEKEKWRKSERSSAIWVSN